MVAAAATRGVHARRIGRPIVQSFEPDENRRWCFFDETYV